MMLRNIRQLSLTLLLAGLTLVLILPPILAQADTPPTFLTRWGTNGIPGTGDGQFNNPRGVAVDNQGNVYVADTLNDRLQKFTITGTFLAKWGTPGTGDGQFNDPEGVAVDKAGNVYVADTGHDRIQKFTITGTFLAKWGSFGSGNGQFNSPRGLAVDSAGNIYVADMGNDRIQKFDSNGTFLTKWGLDGSDNGEFNNPRDVAVDQAGNVYVADKVNHRIQKFDSNGTFLTKWGTFGINDGQFDDPEGVAVDKAGNVYVADTDNHRIQKFDGNGTFLAKWGTFGGGDSQFDDPEGIAVDQAGNVYVADTDDHHIQKFGQPSLSLIKTVNNTQPQPGQRITYTITISNNGAISATAALISDTLPVSTTFAGPVTLIPTQSQAILATSAQSLPHVARNVTITAATQVTLTFPVTIDSNLTGTFRLINTAAVTSAELSTPITDTVIIGDNNFYLPIIFKSQ